MFEIITAKFTNLAFACLAIIALGGSAISIVKIARLNARFNAGIVLIPLYKRSLWPAVAILFFIGLLIANIFVIIAYDFYFVCFAMLVICLSIIALLIAMIKSRSAVLDSGVVVPYRFIDWSHLYDYGVEGDTIFFCGDEKGFDTLNGATTKLRFDPSNIEKLRYVLDKHKLK